jgi:hypothetical protein
MGSETELPVLRHVREGSSIRANLPNDEEAKLLYYGRTYKQAGREWGVMESQTLLDYVGLGHTFDGYGQDLLYSEIHTSGVDYTGAPHTCLSSDSTDEDQIYQMYFGHDGHYMWGPYIAGWESLPLAELRLSVSYDYRNFFRPLGTHSILPLGEKGDFDSGQITSIVYGYNAATFENVVAWRGTTAHRLGGDDLSHHVTSIGVGTIRADGWSYWETDSIGSLVTTLFTPPAGRALFVNAAGVQHRTDLQVDLLDASGNVIEGFASGNPTYRDNRLDNPITWQGTTTLPEVACRVRFRLRSGSKLYSFRFGATPGPLSSQIRFQSRASTSSQRVLEFNQPGL